MELDKELIKWLSREEKSFEDSLKFAINAWNSLDLSFGQKYEVIFTWFSENVNLEYAKNTENFNWRLIEEFFQLKCPLQLLSTEVKGAVAEVLIKLSKIYQKSVIENTTRKPLEIFHNVMETAMMQGYFRSEPEMFSRVLGAIFSGYNLYIKSLNKLNATDENEFFTKVIKSVKEFVQRLPEIEGFRKKFTKRCLKSLIEIQIYLNSKHLNFFSDVLEIEKSLYYTNDIFVFHTDFFQLPTHVILESLVYGLEHFRGYNPFVKQVIEHTIVCPLGDLADSSPGLKILVASHVLNVFRKRDIALNFDYEETKPVVQVIGARITEYFDSFYETYMDEVLTLLCSVLRLNPLIIEKQFFSILVKCLVAKKSDKCWKKYEEFLILFLDVIRKLSKPEKFVFNLLDNLKEHLKEQSISKKLKRKAKDDCHQSSEKKARLENGDESIMLEIDSDYEVNFYFSIILNKFNESQTRDNISENFTRNRYWTFIHGAWPSDSVGLAFSRLISRLMTKPSLTIWKTLIFSMNELLNEIEESQLNENFYFLLDFHAALLCQYFDGTHVLEHADQFWTQINAQRNMTRDFLQKLGESLLQFEHNRRTMSVFLKISYQMGYFDLIMWNYRPDWMKENDDMYTGLHNYLKTDQWTLIEQRIANFGKRECKINMNRIFLQRLQAQELMLDKPKNLMEIERLLPLANEESCELIKDLFSDSNNLWLIKDFTRENKQHLCDVFLMANDSGDLVEFLKTFTEFHDFFVLILINLYKYTAAGFLSKKSILASIDFDELLTNSESERIESVVRILTEKNEDYTIKKWTHDHVEKFLKIIAPLSVGVCYTSTKMLLFTLNMALYRDLLAAKDDELAKVCYELQLDILFGDIVPVLKYFDIEFLIMIFPPSKCVDFYKFIFRLYKDMGNIENLTKAIEILKSKEDNLDDDHSSFCVNLIESLSHFLSNRSMKKYLEQLLNIYEKILTNFFNKDKRNVDQDEIFLRKTLPAFPAFVKQTLGKLKDSNCDENLIRICKIYLNHSVKCRDSNTIKLVSVSLLHKNQLQIDQEQLDNIIQTFWDNLMEDLKSNDDLDGDHQNIVKMIMLNTTSEKFVRVLNDLEEKVNSSSCKWICYLLGIIASSIFSHAKVRIFIEYTKRIIFRMKMMQERSADGSIQDKDALLSILKCYNSICNNSKIHLPLDFLDEILCFLVDLRLPKLSPVDMSQDVYFAQQNLTLTICIALIKFNHLLITDRIPQLMRVFQDCLQTLTGFKSVTNSLTDDETNAIVEIADKLESVIRLLTLHSADVKRVAPYMLISTLNLLQNKKESIALRLPRVELHTENICYHLMSICDHRVQSFILRCSNDGVREIYEELSAEYKKSRKFVGKV